jgi:hypothetical protein
MARKALFSRPLRWLMAALLAALMVVMLMTAAVRIVRAEIHDEDSSRPAAAKIYQVYLPEVLAHAVDVTPSPPVIVRFGGAPATIVAGAASTLSWQVTGATEVRISPDVGVVTGGIVDVSPATTTEYILTASNAHYSVTAKTTVRVETASGNAFTGVVFGQDRFLEGADVATDGQGSIHYLFSTVSTDAQTGKGWTYARCPVAAKDGCADPAKWQLVALGRTDALAQLVVTDDGRPRVWLKSTLAARPIFAYGECNSSCDRAENWHFVDVVHSKYWYPSLEELEYRHESFALDPQGRPRFVYFHYDDTNPDVHGMRYAFCNSNCTSEASWDTVRISSTESLWRPALAFTAAGQPRIVAMNLQGERRMMYVQCDSDCESADSWPEVPLFGAAGGHVSWSLAIDPNTGAVRVAYHAEPLSKLWMMWCPVDCLDVEKWDGVALTLDNAPGGRNPALALDGAGRPHIAYEYADASQNGLGYLRCASDCYTLSTAHKGVWEDQVVESGEALLEAYPLFVPQGCKDPAWLSGLRPSLALDGRNRARFAFEADGYSYCNKGTKEDPWFYYGQYWGTSRLLFEQ